MKRHFATIPCLFLLALSGAARAHEGEQHILGKVTAVSAKSITVETAGKEPKTVTVPIVAQTKFLKSCSEASWKDLKVGERVVIHAQEKDNKLEATLVSFGKPAQAEKHH